MNKTPRNAQGHALTFEDIKVWLAATGPNHLICHEGWHNFIIPAMRAMAGRIDELLPVVSALHNARRYSHLSETGEEGDIKDRAWAAVWNALDKCP